MNESKPIGGYEILYPVARSTGSTPFTTGAISVTPVNTQEQGEQIHSAAFSSDGCFTAVAFGNGALEILDAYSADFQMQLRQRMGAPCDGLPTTSVRWHPSVVEGQYTLSSTSSEGATFLWKLRSSEGMTVMDRVAKFQEQGNEVNVCDFSPDGTVLATAGSDRTVRLYDPVTAKATVQLTRGYDQEGHSRPAHSNRIFSAKFATTATLLTGGWESPIQIWDLRTGRAERQVGGSHVASDAIEILPGGNKAVVASNRDTQQLMVFDFIGGREVECESAKLCTNIGRRYLTQVRCDAQSGRLWVSSVQPSSALMLDLASGAVLATIEDLDRSFPVVALHPTNPRRCLLGGASDALLIVDAM